MSNPHAPNSAQLTCTYPDDAPSSRIETSEKPRVERLTESNVKLSTQNRLLRRVIKELQIANTEAEVEKNPPSAMNVGIFEKIDADLNLHFSPVQQQKIDVWTSRLDEIAREKKNFDATGAEVDREKYESAIRSWRRSHIRRDDIDIIICQRVVAERMIDLTDALKADRAKLESEISRLKSEVEKLNSDVATREERLKVQSDVAGLREREKRSEAQIKREREREKELEEKNQTIADLKEKEKASIAEMKSKYEKELKEKDAVIGKLEQRQKSSAADMKNGYEKKLKEQGRVIASLEKRERSSKDGMRIEYEEMLKERSRIIAQLEEERLALSAEMKELRRELAAHREVSISILDRKRELMKPQESRSDHVIETGNRSAHWGTCLADIFRIKSDPEFDDSPWFVEHYGVDMKTVEIFSESMAFTKLLNMRYDMYNCRGEHRSIASEFEEGFQALRTGILQKGADATTETIDCFLLKNKKAKVTFQKLCNMWDITRASQRKRFQESRDPKKRSIFGGSMRSSASVMTGETQKKTRLDKIEEYGKDMLASAKVAMPWTKQ
ncbi:hypothetical protein DSL72_007586 [Monilinia vaccinii-corymbosi]|uniref:Uncharacterized protein n=1 Tax=Monilinia vaccinii-corymbosi TaxID=61207 RepID=A0A8A3PIB9_9HELO|nr:hypothetical protein DSL72_007586 [Monilinia vaccinii-corymbosi]